MTNLQFRRKGGIPRKMSLLGKIHGVLGLDQCKYRPFGVFSSPPYHLLKIFVKKMSFLWVLLILSKLSELTGDSMGFGSIAMNTLACDEKFIEVSRQ